MRLFKKTSSDIVELVDALMYRKYRTRHVLVSEWRRDARKQGAGDADELRQPSDMESDEPRLSHDWSMASQRAASASAPDEPVSVDTGLALDDEADAPLAASAPCRCAGRAGLACRLCCCCCCCC